METESGRISKETPLSFRFIYSCLHLAFLSQWQSVLYPLLLSLRFCHLIPDCFCHLNLVRFVTRCVHRLPGGCLSHLLHL